MPSPKRKRAGKQHADKIRADDPDYYAKIGAIGGKKGKRKLSSAEARRIGILGGKTPKKWTPAQRRAIGLRLREARQRAGQIGG